MNQLEKSLDKMIDGAWEVVKILRCEQADSDKVAAVTEKLLELQDSIDVAIASADATQGGSKIN